MQEYIRVFRFFSSKMQLHTYTLRSIITSVSNNSTSQTHLCTAYKSNANLIVLLQFWHFNEPKIKLAEYVMII